MTTEVAQGADVATHVGRHGLYLSAGRSLCRLRQRYVAPLDQLVTSREVTLGWLIGSRSDG